MQVGVVGKYDAYSQGFFKEKNLKTKGQEDKEQWIASSILWGMQDQLSVQSLQTVQTDKRLDGEAVERAIGGDDDVDAL